jgi:hypothetical protein
MASTWGMISTPKWGVINAGMSVWDQTHTVGGRKLLWAGSESPEISQGGGIWAKPSEQPPFHAFLEMSGLS